MSKNKSKTDHKLLKSGRTRGRPKRELSGVGTVSGPAPVGFEATSTSDRLLEAFCDLLGKSGIENITLQKLAEETGVAFGTVRYHFAQPGKSLVDSAMLYAIGKSYAYLEDSLYKRRARSDFHPIADYIFEMHEFFRLYRRYASSFVLYYHMCCAQRETHLPNTVFVERARLRIKALAGEAIGLGLYPPQTIEDELIVAVHDVVLGSILVACTIGTDEEFARQIRVCQKLCDGILSRKISV